MNIVLITGDGLGHRYVANRLASEVDLAAIVVDQGTAGKGRVGKLWRRYTAGQLVSRAILRFLAAVRRDRAHQAKQTIKVLEWEKCGRFDFPHLVKPVRGINSKESRDLISSLKPDVLLIFGTSVVREGVLSLASKISLNLHTGISPYYRGADCAFWALHNHELNMLGATIHECTMHLDGGRIFARGHARLEANDDLYSAFARCLMTGADLYVSAVKDLLSGKLDGVPQDLGIGREYRAVMRDVRADLKVRRDIKGGLIRRYVLAQENSAERPEGHSQGVPSQAVVRSN